MENNPMTVGELREMLPEPGSPDYDLPVKVYVVGYYNSHIYNIIDIVKVSELTKPKKDFYQLEYKIA